MEKPLFAALGLRLVCVISLPCPTCGSELAFLEQYQRHYCYACGNYAPEGYGDRGAKICPTCRGILSYVAQYDRPYCYRCNAYPADDAVIQSLEATMPVDVRPAPETIEPAVVVTEPETTEPAEKPVEVERKVDIEKAVEPVATVDEAPAATVPQPEEIVEEELPHAEPAEPPPRPPIVRLKVFQAKKPALMDLQGVQSRSNRDKGGTPRTPTELPRHPRRRGRRGARRGGTGIARRTGRDRAHRRGREGILADCERDIRSPFRRGGTGNRRADSGLPTGGHR